jgi:hypothetical protein
LSPQDASEEGFTIRDRRGRDTEPEVARPPERAATIRPEASPAPPRTAEVAPEADLAALFLLLANSALYHLGEGADASSEAALVDLAQAQFSIDLLRLLREKTEGHRSPDENRLLDGILHDLEMRYVRAARPR